VVALLLLAVAAAAARGSAVRAGAPEGSDVPGAIFLAALAAGFVLYLVALVLLLRRRCALVAVCAVAAAVQLAPLAGPLMLSRDVYAYWA
jgi:hypothetical protein